MRLGTFPTPLERIEIQASSSPLWVKREDRSGGPYGGNKVRRLAAIFDDARRKNAKRIVTIGAVGSHHVLACAIYGRDAGFVVEAHLVAQPASPFARENIACALAHGLIARPTIAPLLPRARLLLSRDAFYVPLGGSSVAGAVANADVVRELDEHVAREGEFDWIVTALGSGATAAGICAALAARCAKTRVLAVTVADPALVVKANAHRLYRAAANVLGAPRPERGRLVVDASFLGGGYGVPSDEGRRAGDIARDLGLPVDPTYTEKAFAATLALRAREPRAKILFLQTRAPAPAIPASAQSLPEAVEKLLR